MNKVLRMVKLIGVSLLSAIVVLCGIFAIDVTETRASENNKTPEIAPHNYNVKEEEPTEVAVETYKSAVQEVEQTEEALKTIVTVNYDVTTEAVEVVTEEVTEEDREEQIVVVEEKTEEVVIKVETEEIITEKVTDIDATEAEVATTSAEVEEPKVEEEVVLEPTPGVALSDSQGKVIAKENLVKYDELAKETIRLINEYRAENGIAPVEFNEALGLVAMHRSAENAWVECFATGVVDGKMHHIRPNGKRASTIFKVYGITGTYAENMGRYQTTPYEIVLGEYGWKNSDTHNELMLDSEYAKVGIGIAQDYEGYYYWTAVFTK